MREERNGNRLNVHVPVRPHGRTCGTMIVIFELIRPAKYGRIAPQLDRGADDPVEGRLNAFCGLSQSAPGENLMTGGLQVIVSHIGSCRMTQRAR